MTSAPDASRPELAGHPHFGYRDGLLHAEGVPLDRLAAELGTPLYVYSRAALGAAWNAYRQVSGGTGSGRL